MARHTILFITGILVYTASFVLPLDDKNYGYSLALLVFNTESDWSVAQTVWAIFVTGITNVAVIVMLVTFFFHSARWVSILALVGAGMALYWMQDILRHEYFMPWASVCWAVGSVLMGIGYEMKRRKSVRS